MHFLTNMETFLYDVWSVLYLYKQLIVSVVKLLYTLRSIDAVEPLEGLKKERWICNYSQMSPLTCSVHR